MDEIRDAIKGLNNLHNMTGQYTVEIDYAIGILERYLAVSEGMPEKFTGTIKKDVSVTEVCKLGYNQAIADCTLALTKKLDGLEEAIPDVVRGCDNYHYLITITHKQLITQVIKDYILGSKP